MKTFLNAEYYARWDQRALNQHLGQTNDFRRCSNVKCSSGQFVHKLEENSFFRCDACGTKSCVNHKGLFHDGLTCAEYDERLVSGEKASKKWIDQNAKMCPKCSIPIEKNGGCDHMKCKQCNHEYCWDCGADFAPIRKHGNEYHKNKCRFHSNNLQ